MRKPYGPRIDRTGQSVDEWTFIEYKGMSKYLMRCSCGTERVLEARAIGLSSHSCGCQFIKYKSRPSPSKDVTGQRFGNWLVLEYSHKSKFLCRCDCGKENLVQRGTLIKGQSQSCGCMAGKRNADNTARRLGRDQIGSARLRAMSHYKKRSRKEGRSFELTDDEIDLLFSSNCYYCNLPPSNKQKTWDKKSAFVYSGIDRIDNNLGYTKDNTISSCKTCNFSKHSRSQEDFLDHARRLVYYQDKKRFDLLTSTQERLS